MYPKAYIEYLIHFHVHRDYFECHEVLEEYWKEEGMKDITWVGLIQIAVALYHQRRSNFQGAIKMLSSAIRILEDQSHRLTQLGIDHIQLTSLLQKRHLEIVEQTPYTSFDLPLQEDVVLQCVKHCQLNEVEWCSNQNITDQFTINKHTLRDRSDVIEEREESIRLKKSR
ncbi:DUF309 domain-containing protein [Bacillus horti]|uniref:Metal-dependent hydrolase n=1 Tax=Caldalkalibacillus horti TaxID=77523 RepID=A0ABT9W3L1_9BACI|nr:DUF309 domain-containing protein [Bacillus horti]MDQ0167844.1 putative metal-dependent hydrolase [Bacillus horti]